MESSLMVDVEWEQRGFQKVLYTVLRVSYVPHTYVDCVALRDGSETWDSISLHMASLLVCKKTLYAPFCL